jgi:hypothetical protein
MRHTSGTHLNIDHDEGFGRLGETRNHHLVEQGGNWKLNDRAASQNLVDEWKARARIDLVDMRENGDYFGVY